jgi:serine-type D-Ala-D-Ala carboxypeptidase (penicillin-binding protein 5/6)
MQQGRALWSHRSHKRREMASLTKMMNLITILELTSSLSLDAKDLRVKASRTACEITGTTAELRLGAEYSLYDLYFGMMLPSGNDAGYLIAELGGYLLKVQQNCFSPSIRDINCAASSEISTYSDQFVNAYLREMNRVARKIEMTTSNFANPHGLSNTNNYSTADDLAKLCTYAMRNPHFRRIVQTRKHVYSLPFTYDKQEVETIASIQTLDEEKENFPSNASL